MDKDDFPYLAMLGWMDEHQNWNNIVADIVDQFGLPGDRYMCHPGADAMQFRFRSEQDLLLFKLKWSEYELRTSTDYA